MRKKLLLVAACLAAAQASRADVLADAQLKAGVLLKNPAGLAALATPIGAPAAEVPALQRHINFFDKNGDGVIHIDETTLGLRQLGLGRVKARAAATVIHLLLGPKTSGTLTTHISVAGIHLGKHGSDTGAYDAQGRFVPEAFERMFAQFDVNKSGSLSAVEIKAMIAANGKLRPGDGKASSTEFDLLLMVASDRMEGMSRAISRERLRRFYDGSLFYELAKPVAP